MSQIFAVVLSFNRRVLLRQCLDALATQTLQCDRIIVVDNGSTDGTSEMLAAEYAAVDVVRVAKNGGAAYGFSLGMRTAIAAGAEHVWVMDDDVIADPAALQHLTHQLYRLEEDGRHPPFVISVARTPEGALTNVPEVDRSRNELHYQLWPVYLDRGIAPVTRSTFVSILVPSRTFNTYGYPMASMYIWGEDTEYTLRVTQREPGFLVGDSKVLHVRAQSGRIEIRAETSPQRLGWHKYLVRNTIYSNFRYRSFWSALYYVFCTTMAALKLAVSGQLPRALILAAGIIEGIVFNPDDAKLDNEMLVDSIVFSQSLADLMSDQQAASWIPAKRGSAGQVVS